MIRVIIERELKSDCYDEYVALISNTKREAGRFAGFLGGELFRDIDNSERIFVISHWNTLNDWLHWAESHERKVMMQGLALLLKTEERVAVLESFGDSAYEG